MCLYKNFADDSLSNNAKTDMGQRKKRPGGTFRRGASLCAYNSARSRMRAISAW